MLGSNDLGKKYLNPSAFPNRNNSATVCNITIGMVEKIRKKLNFFCGNLVDGRRSLLSEFWQLASSSE